MSENSLIKDIFDKVLTKRSLFKDRNVLRSEYIPKNLPFREEQIKTIAQILSPLLKGSRCSNLLLYGKTGTGKTAVTKYVLKALEETANSQNLNLKTVYCNTRIAGTEYRILYELSNYLGLKIPFTGLALKEVSERILNYITSMKFGVIFTLDEIDFLVKNSGDNLLYEFTRANERLKEGSLSLIGISNDLKFKELLDPRVLSSLSEEEMVFPPYTAEELKIILSERAKMAFNNGCIDDVTLNLCAALAASEHGDARRALDLLRVAGEIAEREGALKVEEKHARIAIRKIDEDRMIDALNSLPLHQKLLLLASFGSQGQSHTGEVYLRYVKLCEANSIEPLTSRRVTTLLSELDMLGLVSATTISKGRYGRTKKISPLISFEVVKKVYREDPFLKHIVDS
ncbi:MAG: orc1/cdc6 family replication initiation protein [Nitrososphaerales archaeon]